MSDWKDDKKWSDRFLPEIKRILGEHLIGEPPVEEDTFRNTDLVVLKMDAVRIACRVRRHEYLERYPDEFTIRAKRNGDTKTELSKIIEGWGDYLFYGFSDREEKALAQWVLLSLTAFRFWFMQYLCNNGGKVPGISKVNKDGSSIFASYKLTEVPPRVIYRRS